MLTIFEVQESGIDVEGDEPQAMSEDFVGDDGGVAPYVHPLYTYRRYLHLSACASAKHRQKTYLCDKNASEGIGDGGIDADEIKVDGAIRETLDSDGEFLTPGE